MMRTDDIAIVGMACRFPEADSPEQFWDNLKKGRESMTPLSEAQLTEAGVPRDVFERPTYVRVATPLADVDKFDAKFFGIPKSEATLMDPQQRILLELSYQALEDAGAVISAQKLETGVYATGGGITRSYLYQVASKLFDGANDTGSQLQLVNDKDFLATRISYKLNLTGPSLSVQTACSSSMVAVHLARMALLAGEIDIAVVAASCIRLPQNRGYDASENMIFSKSGHCRTFSEDSDGTIFGSGSGVVVLKRYEDAKADGDNIYALIKSTVINNDGGAKFGYTASSVPGQAKTMVKAIAKAGISADQLSYIECHGTATKIGDPLEIKSLEKAFRLDTAGTNFCHIGSVKPNIGHLEQAAGIAGLIKVALMIKNRKLIPTINFSAPNPKLKLEQTPFRMALEYQAWKPPESAGQILYAGLNCLGVGGTNVFAILSEAPQNRSENQSHGTAAEPDADDRHGLDVVCISAKSSTQLVEYLRQISATAQHIPLTSIAYNMNISRSHLPVKYVALVSDDVDATRWFDQAIAAIEARVADERPSLAGQSLCYVCNPLDIIADDQISKLISDYRFGVFAETYTRLMASADISMLGSSGLTSAPELAKTLAFECALYYQIKSWGIGVETFIGQGFGRYASLALDETPIDEWIGDLEEDTIRFKSDLADGRFSCFENMGQGVAPVKTAANKCENTVFRCTPNTVDIADESCIYLSRRPGFEIEDVWSFLIHALSRGINLDWDKYYPRGANRKISLPGYPFEKKRYWLGDDAIVA